MSNPTPSPAPSGSVLVVGPGVRGRGGIASVIRTHAQTETWHRRGLRHLSTFNDRSPLHKACSALAAYAAAPLLLWRAKMVHIHLAAQTSILRKLPFVALARLMARPIIVHVHAPSEASIFEHTPRWATSFLFTSAARVVALSESWATIFRAHHPRTPVMVIPNAIPNPAAPSHPSASPRIILFAGKLDARKGYADLLAAAPAVLQQFPDTEFHFAGHGELEAARALASRLGIAPSVHLHGWLDAPALDALYAQSTAFVLPSYAEGVPMSVLEAMSHAVPVITTPVGGLPELIRDGENAIFVTPGDVPALTHSIAALLRHPARAAALGAAGRLTVRQCCSLESVSAQLEALYAGVAAEQAQTRPSHSHTPTAPVHTRGTK